MQCRVQRMVPASYFNQLPTGAGSAGGITSRGIPYRNGPSP